MPPPPPSASVPLGQRLTNLAQTLQFGWFVGHLVLLLCVLRYSLSWITFNTASGMAAFTYRTAFVSAAATYGIVVYKAYRARMRLSAKQQGNTYLALIADENVQYLAMALVWICSRQIPLAMLPFAVYSVFHVATYVRSNLIPVFYPPTVGSGASPGKAASASSPLADTIGRFVKTYYDSSMNLVALLEIALWFRVLGSALTFSKGSWVLLLIYTAFFRSRYSQSTFVQATFHNAAARVDALVADQNTPPAVRQAWQTVKGLVRQATDATDMRKYTGGPQPVKKAQ